MNVLSKLILKLIYGVCGWGLELELLPEKYKELFMLLYVSAEDRMSNRFLEQKLLWEGKKPTECMYGCRN